MYKEFFDFMRELDGKTYLEYYITYLISPVFTGVKPASLIGLDNKNNQLLNHWYDSGDDYLKTHNLKSIVLKRCPDKDLILIYNEEILLNSLNEHDNRTFLEKLGYKNFQYLNDILETLYERYNTYHCPHEIGIFLGIPLPDVEAFMDCAGRNCLLCGYWKVFSNEEKARQLFKVYDWSKEMVMTHSLSGREITWITDYLRVSSINV